MPAPAATCSHLNLIMVHLTRRRTIQYRMARIGVQFISIANRSVEVWPAADGETHD